MSGEENGRRELLYRGQKKKKILLAQIQRDLLRLSTRSGEVACHHGWDGPHGQLQDRAGGTPYPEGRLASQKSPPLLLESGSTEDLTGNSQEETTQT